MQVSVENISKIERRLTIAVPSEKVDVLYRSKIDSYAKNAKLKGFRPGKVPLSIIKQRFGLDAQKEAVGETIQGALQDALKETHLRPINMPKIEVKNVKPDEPLEFTASFEVFPEIGPIQCELPAIEKPVVELQDEDIQQVITELRKQYTEWQVVEREIREKDRVVVDFYTIMDGKEDLEHKVQGLPIEIGGNTMIPGFESGLVGARAGETRTLSLHFPNDYPMGEKAGKPADFVVDIKQLFEATVPELNAEFMQKLGVKSGQQTDLEAQIRQTLDYERTQLINHHLKEQVFGELLKQNPIDVPLSLIEREAKNIHDEIYQHQKNHDHKAHTADEMATFNEMAKKRVALGLLIGGYAKQLQLKPDPDKVAARIWEIASIYESPEEVVTWLSSEEKRSGIENQVLEEQVLEKLMETATIQEKPMRYAELKGRR